MGALEAVAPSVARDTTMGILRHSHLVASGGRVKVEAGNLRSQVSVSFQGEGEGEIDVMIPPNAKEFLKRTKEKEISLTEKGGKITLKAGKSRATMVTLPSSEYPKAFAPPQAPWFTSNQVVSALLRGMVCAERKQTFPPYINGVVLDLLDGELVCASTDAKRMALVTLPIEGASGSVVLPLSEMGGLRSLDPSEDVTVSIDGSAVFFEQESVTVGIIRMAATFPDFRKIILDGFDEKLVVNTDAFGSAVDRAAIVAREGERAVVLHLSEGQVTLTAHACDVGDATEDIDAETEGPEVTVGFNSAFLLAGLGLVESDTTCMHFHGPTGQAQIIDSDMRYLLMPISMTPTPPAAVENK